MTKSSAQIKKAPILSGVLAQKTGALQDKRCALSPKGDFALEVDID